jgi:uncharacterized protein involved in outer membrane biogenesis
MPLRNKPNNPIMRRRRAALILPVAVVAAAGAALFVAVQDMGNPERLRREMQDRARATWGRELSVEDASLDVLPIPTVHMRNVALGNPPWARDRAFITAQSVDARLAILPLLTGKVRVKALLFEHGTLALEKRPDGSKTWGIVPAQAPRNAGNDQALDELVAVTARDVAVTWRDGTGAAVPWRIESLEGDSGGNLRDARIDAKVARRGRPLSIRATFDDLSHRGEPGALTDATVQLDWGTTQLAVKGRIPLDGTMNGHAVHADLESSRLNDLFAFFEITRRPTASAEAHFDSRDAAGVTDIKPLALRLGNLHVQGEGHARASGRRTVVDARLAADRLDWVRTLADAGAEPIPKPEPPEMFLSTPFAWPLLESLDGVQGSVDARFDSVKLRNGVELTGLATKNTFDGDKWHVISFSTSMLGGNATGSLDIEGHSKSARMRFNGTGLALERWFHERGSAIPFHGGPMTIEAQVSASGDSMRAMAESLTGPVTIRLTRGSLANPKAGAAEAKLVGASEENQPGIEFECVSANLPFRSGRAERSPIIAARSDLAYLVTSGFIDFRDETLELRGRVKPLHSGNVGMSAIAGDVVISGPIRAPHIAHDASRTPAAVARGAAAIATLGLSALATAHADAVHAAENDPCASVL